MEARFAHLEALVTSMAAQMKSTTSGPRKVKDREDDQSCGQDADQGFFCGVTFLGSMTPNEMMPHMSRNHDPWVVDDGNRVMVPNPSEMISTYAIMIRASTHVPEP
jgi:hypothetical protein